MDKTTGMKMTNMKSSPAQKEAMSAPVPSDAPEYPYGLCVHLDKEDIGKLKLGKPAGGDEMLLTAKVFVKEVAVTDRADGEGYESMELQITDMALEPVEPPKKPMSADALAAGLYGGKA